MRTVTSSIDLDAPPQRVWDVLMDTPEYASWNPFITRLQGDLEVGSKLGARIAPPGSKPRTFAPTVTEVDSARRLAWLGRFVVPGVFDGAHSFTLEPLPNGRTRLVQSERFTGVLVWFAGKLLRNTAAGFDAMNAALQQRLAQGAGRNGRQHP